MRTPIMSCCRLMAVALFLFCSMPLFAQRQDILLNDNWKFRFSHQVQKGSEIRVDLPHTWNTQDALSGKIDYKRGIGNYEKKLIHSSRMARQASFPSFRRGEQYSRCIYQSPSYR